MTQALCYFPDPADPMLAAVRRALLPLKLRLRLVPPEQTGQKVGYLLGRKGFEEEPGNAPPVANPLLVLDGLSPAQLDQALRTLSKAKVPRSVFKAVATADNTDWTLARLWEELKTEREALERGETPAHS